MDMLQYYTDLNVTETVRCPLFVMKEMQIKKLYCKKFNLTRPYTQTHTYSIHMYLQESSSVLLGVFPLTEPLRPYSPLLPLMKDLVSPGL